MMRTMQPQYVQPPVAQRVIVIKPVNHAAHFVMSLLTGGLWIIVWVGVVIRRRDKIRGV